MRLKRHLRYTYKKRREEKKAIQALRGKGMVPKGSIITDRIHQ